MHKDEHKNIDKPEYHFSSLVEMLRYRATNQPDDLAYTFLLNGEEEGESLTFGELDAKARMLAVRLLVDVAPGDRALLLYPPSLDYVVGFFGCLYAGIIPVPSYPPKPNRPDLRLQSIARDASPAVSLCNEDTLRDLHKRIDDSPDMRKMQWIATNRLNGEDGSSWSEPDLDADSLAFLQYTSGSTSTPKGVMVSHGNLLQVMKEGDMSWGFSRDSKMVTWLPIFHDMGLIYGILQIVYSGVPCVFMASASFLQKPIRWLQAITRYKGTHSAAPNFAYELCVEKINEEQRAGLDLSHWAVANIAAEPVRAYTMRRFADFFAPVGFSSKTLCPAFGLAESTLKATSTCYHEESVFAEVFAAELRLDKAVSPASSAVAVNGGGDSRQTLTLVSSGHTLGETSVVIADPETREQCPENRVGEIWVSGPIVAKGYWRRPEETAETFQAMLSNSDEGPFLRTGDLGFIRGDECYVTGRLKDVIIIRGINHYPQDIELTVQHSHAALQPDTGAAFSIEVDGEERLVVVQEVRRTFLRNVNHQEVFSAVRRAIFDIHELQVHAIALLRTASILKTSSGKIQRRACKAQYLDDRFPIVASWTAAQSLARLPTDISADSTQHWIMQWVAYKFGRDLASIDPRHSFDACGMDSLSAVEFAHDLGVVIGREIDEITVWNYPTIETLSRHVTHLNGTGERTPEPRTLSRPAAHDEESLEALGEKELVDLLYDEIGRRRSEG
jgi:acyl-CoA synthetase (AMP-forming)/AMP-acid ligase II/acyl carrier protein